jgi:hypothetical protein
MSLKFRQAENSPSYSGAEIDKARYVLIKADLPQGEERISDDNHIYVPPIFSSFHQL